MAMRQPAEYGDEIEREPTLPAVPGERFSGYGVMGLPFRSGHILGLRRFSASSIGPGYRSVWHRAPSGRWTFYQDQPAELACTRYFGAAVEEVREGPIEIGWDGAAQLGGQRRRRRAGVDPGARVDADHERVQRSRLSTSRPCVALAGDSRGDVARCGACSARRPGAPGWPRAERTALRRQSAAYMGCAREFRPPARHRPRCNGPRSQAGATARLRDPSARRVRSGPRLLCLRGCTH